MRGTVKKEGSSWYYRVYTGIDPITLKKKYKKKRGFRTRKECEEELAKVINEINNGTYINNESMEVSEYLDYWYKQYVEKNCADSTCKRYMLSINDVKKYLGKIKLMKLSPLNVQQFYEDVVSDKGISENTLLKTHRTLHMALKHAVQWRMINTNPCDYVVKAKETKAEIKFWMPDRISSILKEIEEESLYGITYLAVYTGMRVGELCALKWCDVDLQKGLLTVNKSLSRNKDGVLVRKTPKTKNSLRTIILLDETITFLRKLKGDSDKIVQIGKDDEFVFHWDDGRPIDPHYVSQKFPAMLKRHNIGVINPEEKISFHGTRHTHATLLLSKGVNPKVTSSRLGHSTTSFTLDTYSHVNEELQRYELEKLTNFRGEPKENQSINAL